jgi:hypothetical protein
MSYLDVDRQRLRYLISMGSEPGETAEFFKNCRSQLISAGASLHKLSDRKDARVDFLSRLSGKAAEVYANWIRARLSVDRDLLPEALIAQFGAVEKTHEEIDPEYIHIHARLGLYYLYRENPPEVWLEFMRSRLAEPVGEKEPAQRVDENGRNQLQTQDTSEALRDESYQGAPNSIDVSEIAAALESGSSTSSQPKGQNQWVTLTVAIAKLWRDPELLPSKLLEGLSDEDAGKGISEQLATIRNSWLSRIRAPEGLEVREPQSLSILGAVDGDRAQVLGRCVGETATSSAAFIEPYGLLVGDEVFALDRKSARELFPETGQIIAFPGPAYPVVGEFGTFITERYQSNQSIKFRARTKGVTAYTVSKVPASSSDPDAIRESLKATGNPLLANFIFRLSDGLMVKTQGDERDLQRYNYDTPLLAWRKLTGWKIGDRIIVLAPLPPADTRLDCSDLATVLRGLLEDEEAIESWPKLTRANVRTLLDYVRDQESLLSERRLRRLERELETFVQSRDGLEAIMSTVLKNDKVQAEFERAKQAVVQSYEASRADLVKAKQGLENEVTQLRAVRSRLQEDNKKIVADVTAAIGKAFEKAQSNGLETLANIAVFEALIDRHDSNVRHSKPQAPDASDVTVEIVHSVAEPAEEIFRQAGIRTSEARSIARVLEASAAVGLSIGLRGSGTNYLAKRLAIAMCKNQCAVIDICVGLVHRQEIKNALATLGAEVDMVLFRSANHSDFSAYGVDIETELLDRLVGLNSKIRSFLFTFEAGPAALPVSQMLEETCLLIDLAWLASADDENPADLASVEERLMATNQMGIGKLKIDAIKKVVKSLESKEGIGDFWIQIILNNLRFSRAESAS